MRIRGIHFEQVPIEVVETILRQATEPARILGKSPAPVTAQERHVDAESLEQEKCTSSTGKL
jgi:hypothetical protein